MGGGTKHGGGQLGILNKNEKRRFRRQTIFTTSASVGPFRLGDLVGIKLAVIVLHQSLKPGRYKYYLQ